MDKVFLDLCADTCNLVSAGVNYIFENCKIEDLPLYLFAFAKNCYVKYDTKNECITDISIRLYNRGDLIVDIEPLNSCITGYVDNQKNTSLKLSMYIADTIFQCVDYYWRYRLEIEGLCTAGKDSRYIAADLLT